MKIKKRYILLLGGFLYTVFTGLLVNTISDLKDNFKSELSYLGLVKDLREAESIPKPKKEKIVVDDFSLVIKEIDELAKKGVLMIICSIKNEMPNYVQVTKLSSLSKYSSATFANMSIDDVTDNLLQNELLSNENIVVIKPSLVSSKNTTDIIEKYNEANFSDLVSVTVKFTVSIYNRNDAWAQVFEDKEYGIGNSEDIAVEEAERKFYQQFY